MNESLKGGLTVTTDQSKAVLPFMQQCIFRVSICMSSLPVHFASPAAAPGVRRSKHARSCAVPIQATQFVIHPGKQLASMNDGVCIHAPGRTRVAQEYLIVANPSFRPTGSSMPGVRYAKGFTAKLHLRLQASSRDACYDLRTAAGYEARCLVCPTQIRESIHRSHASIGLRLCSLKIEPRALLSQAGGLTCVSRGAAELRERLSSSQATVTCRPHKPAFVQVGAAHPRTSDTRQSRGRTPFHCLRSGWTTAHDCAHDLASGARCTGNYYRLPRSLQGNMHPEQRPLAPIARPASSPSRTERLGRRRITGGDLPRTPSSFDAGRLDSAAGYRRSSAASLPGAAQRTAQDNVDRRYDEHAADSTMVSRLGPSLASSWSRLASHLSDCERADS
ncbi:hypothetical protein OH76DRAFT_1183075 [Lentinus brumalis]|uniref:Uncharacterized protein n=1 Tax=Lentinus brumalis TaxID=2498619 RepID=A0A371CTY8_9APHY|nr:hypothetical protein OH76DRAFT_1183075 [Polyporus brumalis]